MLAAVSQKTMKALRAPLPSEQGWTRLMRLHGATFLTSLLREILIRREILPDGAQWMDDVDAERMVLYGMGAGLPPPERLKASDFVYGFHKYLFDFIRLRRITPEDAIDSEKMIGLLFMARHSQDSFYSLTPAARRRAIPTEQVDAIDKIAEVGGRKPQMLFSHACDRVFKLSVRRRVHHRTLRLLALIEQTASDPKELWREHRGITELLTELTGDDGKVHGW
jgi:hypothetical protein